MKLSISFFFVLAITLGANAQSENISWIKIGDGVQYSVTNNPAGEDIFIGFSGWSVKQDWANVWVKELYKSKLNELGVEHLFSIKGPDDVCYSNSEINLDALSKFILSILKSSINVNRVIVAAHSSGSYVAHEFFKTIFEKAALDKDSTAYNKIIYFNLDGGIGGESCGTELTEYFVEKLQKIYCVSAFNPAIDLYSPNYRAMQKLSKMYDEKTEEIILDAELSFCIGEWCLHNFLINTNPYNKSNYDLEKDYSGIGKNNPVQAKYLDVLIQDNSSEEKQ